MFLKCVLGGYYYSH